MQRYGSLMTAGACTFEALRSEPSVALESRGTHCSVIIPAHNEAARISRTIDDFARTFADSEVIVVANGCCDTTAAVVTRLASRYPNVRLLNIAEAIGKGGAVRAGAVIAEASIVAYVDADHATSASELRRLCGLLDGHDAVIASRWRRGAVIEVRQGLRRRVASRALNMIVRLLFGLRFTDTQCGAKIFKKTALDRVLPNVQTSNFAFDVDLLYAAHRAGLRVLEAPTVWRDVAGSSVRLVPASVETFAALVRLRVRYSILHNIAALLKKLFATARTSAQVTTAMPLPETIVEAES